MMLVPFIWMGGGGGLSYPCKKVRGFIQGGLSEGGLVQGGFVLWGFCPTFRAPPFEQTYPSTIRVQYLRILLCSFGEEDFSKVCIKFAKFKLSLTIISLIM